MMRTAPINASFDRARTREAESCLFASSGFHMGQHRLPMIINVPHRQRNARPLAACFTPAQSLTEAPPDYPNPIALPHPPRQRLPSNGPIKTAPRKISAHSCLIERGSPDRVLSFIKTDKVLV